MGVRIECGVRPISDTIVAPVTAVSGAIAVVRLSGPDSFLIASRIFNPWPESVESHRAVYGKFANGDEGLALPFEQGRGYTGEQTVEFSCHGAPASVRTLLERCQGAGARHAEPGEFTLRAFLNGRMDLSQAEAVRETVEAQTDAQLRNANLIRSGALTRAVGELRAGLTGLLAAVEASVDFSEEVGDLDRKNAEEILRASRARLGRLLETAEHGRILRHGLKIALVGRPNVGKSSLLNALLQADRSIVSHHPGTTRDFVEERADLAGVPAVLIDTAGLRESEDPVEIEGVERTRKIAAAADLVWYVYDAAEGWHLDDERELAALQRPAQVLANKVDLAPNPTWGIPVSAQSGEGLQALGCSLRHRAFGDSPPGLTVGPRATEELKAADSALQEAESTLLAEHPDDLLAVTLRDALAALGRITGETATDDMLERIFRDFCIGK